MNAFCTPGRSFSRRLFGGLGGGLALSSLLLLAACGGGGDAGPGPGLGGGGGGSAAAATGSVVFKLSLSSCNASRNMRFFISGKQVGNETLFGGESSHAYTANAGANEWAADVIDVSGRQTASWLGRVTVPAGGQADVLLECQLKR
jgi:hypothetical protein